jgi:hypothetical protein
LTEYTLGVRIAIAKVKVDEFPDNSIHVKVSILSRLGRVPAWWLPPRNIWRVREREMPGPDHHKHCRLSRGVKGLSAVRPAWRPVDCRSREILLPSG